MTAAMPDPTNTLSGNGEPASDPASRVLRAIQADELATARRIVEEHPEEARFSIHVAAAVGNAPHVAERLAADPSLATRRAQGDGPEPIILAAHCGLQSLMQVPVADRVRTATLLLDAGASPNAFVQLHNDPHARIPALYFACVSGNAPVAKLLLERGAEPNDGESVYHAAEHDHEDCLDLLVSHGADVSNAHARWGNTPLFFVAGHSETSPLRASAERGIRWLLEHGADPNVVSSTKPQAESTPGSGETPLHRVAMSDRSTTIASLLLSHGADVEMPRADGKTAYTLAYRAANMAMALMLAQHGARTDALSDTDRFLAACLTTDDAEAGALLATRADLMRTLSADEKQVLMGAVHRDDPDAIALMISLSWSLTEEGQWGGTPLHWASWFGRGNAVRALLEHGAPVNARDSTYGSSPIAWAAHGSTNSRPGNDADYIAIVQLLLDAGATRAASFNSWEEAPESMASTAVAARLKDSGFTSQ
jgi:ankyrin repeat protein